jgi:hypothetical protein
MIAGGTADARCAGMAAGSVRCRFADSAAQQDVTPYLLVAARRDLS